jgi:hypothetical protein
MIHEQELHDALLGNPSHFRGALGPNIHSVSENLSASRLGFGDSVNLNETGPARGNRCEKWVITESRDLDTNLFSRPNDKGSFGDFHFDAINDYIDRINLFCVISNSH